LKELKMAKKAAKKAGKSVRTGESGKSATSKKATEKLTKTQAQALLLSDWMARKKAKGAFAGDDGRQCGLRPKRILSLPRHK
jgi:hypothetical protein